METLEWSRKEKHLWDAMMTPGRRKISLHSVPPAQRAKLRDKIEEQKEREFTAGWQAYRDWISH